MQVSCVRMQDFFLKSCRSLGKCVGALAGVLMLAENTGRTDIFYVTALAPLLVALASPYIDEKRHKSDADMILLSSDGAWEETIKEKPENPHNWKFYMKNMFNGFIKTDMWKFCLVATCYIIAPGTGAGYFYYYQDTMGVPDFALQVRMLFFCLSIFR